MKASVRTTLWAPLIVVIPGFLFLAREFRLYSLPIAVAYFPAIWVTLYGALYVVMILYGVAVMSGFMSRDDVPRFAP